MTKQQAAKMRRLSQKIAQANKLLLLYRGWGEDSLTESQKRRVLELEADLLLLDAETKQNKEFRNEIPI